MERLSMSLNDFGTIGTVETWRNILEGGREDFFYGNYMQSSQNKQMFIDKDLTFDNVLDNPQILDNALVYYLRKNCL